MFICKTSIADGGGIKDVKSDTFWMHATTDHNIRNFFLSEGVWGEESDIFLIIMNIKNKNKTKQNIRHEQFLQSKNETVSM